MKGNVAVIMPDQIIGLNIGSLAEAQLPDNMRRLLAAILIGGFALIGGFSWWASRRRNGK